MKSSCLSLAALTAAGSLHAPQILAQPADFWSAVTSGSPSLQIRPRYEYVDQEGVAKEANALTVRFKVGYTTGDFKNLKANLELDAVETPGDPAFNNTRNGKTDYPVVADPEDAGINAAWLSYSGVRNAQVKLGRQSVALDNQRFVGPVGWRQNETTLDALRVVATPMDPLTLQYIYVDKVHRLFGKDHPGSCSSGAACSIFDMTSHLLHGSYTLPGATFTGYAYLLEFDDLTTRSQATWGGFVTGSLPAGSAKLNYRGEYATQSDYADGADTIDATYYHIMAGATASGVTANLGREVLGGDGNYGFSTPLATVHAFNGWADKFLSTPAEGLVDTYVDVSSKIGGVKVKAVYHIFAADDSSTDFGSELDLLAARKVNKYLAVAVKYADYKADSWATDTRKLWLQADVRF